MKVPTPRIKETGVRTCALSPEGWMEGSSLTCEKETSCVYAQPLHIRPAPAHSALCLRAFSSRRFANGFDPNRWSRFSEIAISMVFNCFA